MKRLLSSLILTIWCLSGTLAQQTVSIGVETTNPNAVLWLKGNGNQGFIIPIVNNHMIGFTPAAGMVVFDNLDKKLWYHDGTNWLGPVGGAGSNYTLQLQGNNVVLFKDATAISTVNIQSVAVGGDLTGTVGSAQIAAGAVTAAEIGPGAVTDVKLSSGITVSKLSPSATNGQVLQTVAGTTQWATLPASIPTLTVGQILVGNGASNSAAAVSGDMTMSNGVFTIGTGAVTDGKLGSGITVSKLSPSATNGQVLQTVAGTTQWATLPAATIDQTAQTGALVGNGSTITGRVASTGGHYFRRNSGNTDFEFGTINATDIPNLDAAKITTGTFPIARINGAGAGTRAILGSVNNTVAWVNGAPNQLLGTDGIGNLSFINQSTFLSGGLTSGQLFVGNASNVATPVTISGDLTVNNTGNAQIAAGSVIDGDVAATAAIAGTKISPNFGTQNVLTTGYIATTGFIGAGTTVPAYAFDATTPTGGYGLNHTDGTVVLSTYTGSGGVYGGAIGTQSNHPFFIYTNNGGARMTIMNATGNVGIGTTAPTTKLEVNGYTKLGSDAPAIRVKKIILTSPTLEGSCSSVAHGVPAGKVISVSAMVEYNPNTYVPAGYTFNAGYQLDWVINPSATIQLCAVSGNSASVLNKPVIITITYEE